MLNFIWLALVVLAVVIGGFTGKLPAVTNGAFESAADAVMKIALPLWGLFALWMGMMRLAERSGLVQVLARAIRPLMRVLFPEVPPDHPAIASMLMNMAANMLGLGNAATPLGLRAMNDLEKLNPHPGTATNAMCTFLAINTSSIQLIPSTAIAILAAAGSKNPTIIVASAFLATACAAVSGVASARVLQKLPFFRAPEEIAAGPGKSEERAIEPETIEKISPPPLTRGGSWAIGLLIALFAGFFCSLVFPGWTGGAIGGLHKILPVIPGDYAIPQAPEFAGKSPAIQALTAVSMLAVPFLFSFFPLYAGLRGVKVYEQFVEGAKESFPVILRIVPFLVAMLVAIRMFREAGGIDLLSLCLTPILSKVRFPVELLPMVLMRPLSGGATMGLFTEVVKRFGPDSFTSRLGATIFGSTETTFYVLAVYFGAVGIRRTRHAVAAGLIADGMGVVASTVICHLLFG